MWDDWGYLADIWLHGSAMLWELFPLRQVDLINLTTQTPTWLICGSRHLAPPTHERFWLDSVCLNTQAQEMSIYTLDKSKNNITPMWASSGQVWTHCAWFCIALCMMESPLTCTLLPTFLSFSGLNILCYLQTLQTGVQRCTWWKPVGLYCT